ncbi:MAG TPA: methyltransferase domain-containing protein [Bryobacteraceae bacterium]|nr:methyltransferase domain-containing protein [Bryobacteraceae bacterium]
MTPAHAALHERVIVPEMLDHAPPDVTRASLRDLARINRFLGGYYVLGRLFDGLVAPSDRFSVLDIGAASGDMGAAIRRRYPQARVTSLDYKDDHLIQAADPRIVADAFALPLRAASFDFVFSSLFLHHFTDDQVVDLFRSFRGVARRAVLAIDLERGPLAYHFLPRTRWLFGWHDITINDGQISVAAAMKKHELRELAQRAGLAQARVKVHRPWSRLSLVAPV